MIELNDLVYAYEKKNVLDGVSLTLDKGEVVVLLGVNGAGKSTLLKIVAGILKEKSGSVSLFGKKKSAYKPREYARHVAYVPQNPTFDAASVTDAVLIGRLPLFTAPSEKDYERAYEAMEQTGISALKAKNAQKLSGGEKRKVAIARALCGDAELLLMDEPTSDLDLKSRYEILEKMKILASQGKTLFVSLHDVNDALEIGDRFIVLHNGKVLADGDKTVLTEELFATVFGLRLKKVEHGGHVHFHLTENEEAHFHNGIYHIHQQGETHENL